LIKTIGEIKQEKISMSKALIKWDGDKIFVVTPDGKHVFSFTVKEKSSIFLPDGKNRFYSVYSQVPKK